MKTQGLNFFIALLLSAGLAASLGLPTFVRADDTEVFFLPPGSDLGSQRNILIVLDNTANWSRQSQQWPGGLAQGQSEVRAIKNAIATLDGTTSVGLMMYTTAGSANDDGGYVRHHLGPMTDANKAALVAKLDTIFNNIESPNEKLNSGTPYGNLMFDVYNYLGGFAPFSGGATPASLADNAGYTTPYSRFLSPLSGPDANCGPTSIVFVTNPNSSGPTADSAANTTKLASLGGNTTQLQVPNFNVSTVAALTPLGLSNRCYTSVAACSPATEFPSQCGTAGSCSCDDTDATAGLAVCPAGQQRYTVAGVTNTSTIVSDTNTVTNNADTGTSTACIKPAPSAGNTQTCPVTTTSSAPSGTQTTTTTTSWASCTASSSGAVTTGCTGGRSKYPILGTRTVRTVVSEGNSTSQTPLGNTFACYSNIGSCTTVDYNAACGGFNGGCVCTGPTTTEGSCPAGSGQRLRVVSTSDTTVVTPNGTFSTAPANFNLDEWARFLNKVGVNGTKVNTYTIDVFKAQQNADHTRLLLSAAKVGGGKYFTATNEAEITNALTQVFDEVLAIDTTFVAPAVTVNTFNRLTNRDELYFALFKPDAQVKWEGNLKKYKLGTVGGVTKIVDAVGADAVNPATGFFRGTAQSVWSAQVDGSEVSQGGFVSRLALPRNAYVYTGTDKPPSATPTPFELNTSVLNSSNTSITKAMVGLPATAPDADLTDILKWVSNVDVDDINENNSRTDVRPSIGDPLHSQPLVVTYRGPEATPDITIYFGTNEGSLHAVNAATGDEVFSFTPKETLKNLSSYRNNIGSFTNRPYGLDGPVTRFHKDLNNDLLPLNPDGTVQSSTVGGVSQSEFVYLYVGMRRGGRNYYSLDITNRASPKLRWVIYGGSGDYAELGQSWSEPVVTRIKLNGVTRDVIVFSGGYDPAQDNKLTLSPDAQGRAVYIADAITGQRLWWASSVAGADLNVPKMVYSTPASPKVVDINGDGIADRIYMSDAGGQVFRIFLNATNTGAATLATGGRIAVLSDADTDAASRTQADARRFFSAPDIALITKNAAEPFLSVSLGSGFREKPNGQNIRDRFFVMRDPDEKVEENNPLSIVTADLFDATANLVQQGTTLEQEAAATALANSKGFYINLMDGGVFKGEKVIADSLTFDNKVLFASFQPGVSTNACAVVAGRSRLYLLNIFNGSAASDLSNFSSGQPVTDCSTTACNTADRAISLMQQGLPPDPTILFPSLGGTLPDKALVCIGAECFEPGLTVETKKTYWLKRSQ